MKIKKSFEGSVCSTDSSCAGYPLAFCDGVCKCREGALNAGSACIAALENGAIMGGTCSNGQVETTKFLEKIYRKT